MYPWMNPGALGGLLEFSWSCLEALLEPRGGSKRARRGLQELAKKAARILTKKAPRVLQELPKRAQQLVTKKGRVRDKLLGPLGGFLGLSLGPSWSSLGLSSAPLGPSWRALEPFGGPLGGLLGRRGAVLGASWNAFDAGTAEKPYMLGMYVFLWKINDFGLLGPSWEAYGAPLGACSRP